MSTLEVTLLPICHKFNHQLTYLANNKIIWNNLRDGFPHPYELKDAVKWVNTYLSEDEHKPFGRFIMVNSLPFLKTLTSEHVEAIKKDNGGEMPDTLLAGRIRGEVGYDVHRCTFEIGYIVGQPFWGKGICTTALKQMVGVVYDSFPEVVRVYATPYKFNEASRKVLIKAGFTYEGCLRSFAIKNGALVDCEMYSILKHEYFNTTAHLTGK